MLEAALAAVAVAAIIVAVAFGALLYLSLELFRDERNGMRLSHDHEREAWRSERRELLNRVQHPQLVPTGTQRQRPQTGDSTRVAAAMQEMANVGRVVPGPPVNGDDPLLPE